MKGLVLFSLVPMIASEILPPAPSNDKKSSFDDYHYDFQSGVEFNHTHGDEFEMLDLEQGGRSGTSVTDRDGNETILKNPSDAEVIHPDELSHGNGLVLAYNDTREDNDSFQNASSAYKVGRWESGIFQHSSWLDATISKKTTGWGFWKKTYIDKDFYSFDACTTGTLKVTLSNVPSECDYDLRAYRLEDGKDAKASSLSFDNYLASSTYGKGHNETITLSVTPGCYYFCVYSFHDETFDDDNPYHLLFEEHVDDTREFSRYWFNQGKAAGDLGAIWVSDYKPLGYTPVTLKDSNARIQFNNYNDYPYIRDLADKYNGNSYINYAVLYIQDLELRANISALSGLLIKKLDENTTWEENTQKNVNIGMSAAGLALSIAGVVISTVTFPEAVAAADLMLSFVGIQTGAASTVLSLASFVESFQTTPTFNIAKKDLLSYLIAVQQSFAVGRGSNTDQIIMLRYRYRFVNSDGKHYLDWSPFYLPTDYNICSGDNISFQIDNSGIDGTVKGFKSSKEIKEFLDFEE